jgi:hypothetical protein
MRCTYLNSGKATCSTRLTIILDQILNKDRDRTILTLLDSLGASKMAGPHPYAWYRCSNQHCGMPIALPQEVFGSQAPSLAGQTTERETVAIACPHCNCICSCTPLGSQAAIPEQVLSRLPHTSYEKIWLRCGHVNCSALIRLLVPAQSATPIGDLKGIVADKRVVGVTCRSGHPISRVIAL